VLTRIARGAVLALCLCSAGEPDAAEPATVTVGAYVNQIPT
jgi:hypothetical protein